MRNSRTSNRVGTSDGSAQKNRSLDASKHDQIFDEASAGTHTHGPAERTPVSVAEGTPTSGVEPTRPVSRATMSDIDSGPSPFRSKGVLILGDARTRRRSDAGERRRRVRIVFPGEEDTAPRGHGDEDSELKSDAQRPRPPRLPHVSPIRSNSKPGSSASDAFSDLAHAWGARSACGHEVGAGSGSGGGSGSLGGG